MRSMRTSRTNVMPSMLAMLTSVITASLKTRASRRHCRWQLPFAVPELLAIAPVPACQQVSRRTGGWASDARPLEPLWRAQRRVPEPEPLLVRLRCDRSEIIHDQESELIAHESAPGAVVS